jgi:large subunit ribosomal protein L19
MNKIDLIAAKYLKTNLPEIKPGMIVRVWQKFSEKEKGKVKKSGVAKTFIEKEITKPFRGIVIAIKHGKGVNRTFTVRGEAAGQTIEKIFPYHSPTVSKIEILGTSKTRRAKLYFLRKLSPHQIRKKLRTQYQ